MENRQKFQKRIIFRLFDEEQRKIRKVVRYAKDFDGGRKYDNVSHFVRCATIKLMQREYKELKRSRGRPKKEVSENGATDEPGSVFQDGGGRNIRQETTGGVASCRERGASNR